MLKLIGLIHNQAVAYKVKDLADILEISTRTAQRYVNTLKDAGFEVKKGQMVGFILRMCKSTHLNYCT